MANRARGEVEVTILGERVTLALHLGALAEIEDAFGGEPFSAVFRQLSSAPRGKDLLKWLQAVLRANGHRQLADEAPSILPSEATEILTTVMSAQVDPGAAPKEGAAETDPPRPLGADGSPSASATSA